MIQNKALSTAPGTQLLPAMSCYCRSSSSLLPSDGVWCAFSLVCLHFLLEDVLPVIKVTQEGLAHKVNV